MSKKIKSIKELSDDWKKWNKNNWKKFTKGFNDFFGIPNKEKTATEHITKETAIDITPEEIKDEIKKLESENNSALIEFENKPLTPQAWQKFENSTMSSFDDMRQKINELHTRNLNKIEEKIKIGKANYRIWLMRNEIKNADLKDQQKLAMQRFKEFSKSNQENVSNYFDQQKEEWQNQFVAWKKAAKAMPGKLKENHRQINRQMRKDYEEWIENRRKRTLKKMKYKIEKSSLRMRLQWRRSLNSMMFFMPLIVIGIIVIILISAINRS